MGRYLFRYLLLFLMFPWLTGCMARPKDYLTERKEFVGSAPGDTIEAIPGIINNAPITLVGVTRAFDKDGRLGLCMAVLVVGPKSMEQEAISYVIDRGSRLTVGAENSGHSIGVLAGHANVQFQENAKGEIDIRERKHFDTLEGDCITTDFAWRPEFKSEHSWKFVKTVYTPTTSYYTIYTRSNSKGGKRK